MGVEAGVDIVRHVASAVVQICCNRHKIKTITTIFLTGCFLPNYVQNYLRVIDKMNKIYSITAVTPRRNSFLSC